jgi:Heterokaryon incompatibility protein (HET)
VRSRIILHDLTNQPTSGIELLICTCHSICQSAAFMRLLNTRTKKLEEFFGRVVPRFAILSHTWGDYEVTYQELQNDPYAGETLKIEGFCRLARQHRYKYVWIDTCCIDKSSSSELGEAINSMYAWYAQAAHCYVYLEDVSSHAAATFELVKGSRWFTRGWTLQELLAPRSLTFYAQDWTMVDALDKNHHPIDLRPTFTELVSQATAIPSEYLRRPFSPRIACAAEIMQWASRRQTTRKEDEAYCLLGLFDVSLALIYGEGAKAFRRLQQEILLATDDHTLFAWGYGRYSQCEMPPENGQAATYKLASGFRGLATAPSSFLGTSRIISYRPTWMRSVHYTMTNKGVQLTLPVIPLPCDNAILVALNCADTKEPGGTILALPLWKLDDEDDMYERLADSTPIIVQENIFKGRPYQTLYLTSHERFTRVVAAPSARLSIGLYLFWSQNFRLRQIYPPPLELHISPASSISLVFPSRPEYDEQAFPVVFEFSKDGLFSILLHCIFKTAIEGVWTSVRMIACKLCCVPFLSESLYTRVAVLADLFEKSLQWIHLGQGNEVVIEKNSLSSLSIRRSAAPVWRRDYISLEHKTYQDPNLDSSTNITHYPTDSPYSPQLDKQEKSSKEQPDKDKIISGSTPTYTRIAPRPEPVELDSKPIAKMPPQQPSSTSIFTQLFPKLRSPPMTPASPPPLAPSPPSMSQSPSKEKSDTCKGCKKELETLNSIPLRNTEFAIVPLWCLNCSGNGFNAEDFKVISIPEGLRGIFNPHPQQFG